MDINGFPSTYELLGFAILFALMIATLLITPKLRGRNSREKDANAETPRLIRRARVYSNTETGKRYGMFGDYVYELNADATFGPTIDSLTTMEAIVMCREGTPHEGWVSEVFDGTKFVPYDSAVHTTAFFSASTGTPFIQSERPVRRLTSNS